MNHMTGRHQDWQQLLNASAIALLTLLGSGACADAKTTGQMHRAANIQVPGAPLASFDGSLVNSKGTVYALADRSNRAVDFFNSKTMAFTGRVNGFVGVPGSGSFSQAGPNGVTEVGAHQIWAGDGDSTIKVMDEQSRKLITSVSTGGKRRVDDLTYDKKDRLVIAANNADTPPFLSVISTQGRPKVLGRIDIPQASHGLEQPVWNSSDDLVYLAIPQVGPKAADGGIAVIDPRGRKVERIIPVSKCMPAGLALGPHQTLLVGCSDDAISAGFAPKSLIINLPSGKTERTVSQVGGSDGVSFDPSRGRFYLAAVANPGGPVIGVINAKNGSWVTNVASGRHAHSVAADPVSGKVFVPVAAGEPNSQCPSGCVAVYDPN